MLLVVVVGCGCWLLVVGCWCCCCCCCCCCGCCGCCWLLLVVVVGGGAAAAALVTLRSFVYCCGADVKAKCKKTVKRIGKLASTLF